MIIPISKGKIRTDDLFNRKKLPNRLYNYNLLFLWASVQDKKSVEWNSIEINNDLCIFACLFKTHQGCFGSMVWKQGVFHEDIYRSLYLTKNSVQIMRLTDSLLLEYCVWYFYWHILRKKLTNSEVTRAAWRPYLLRIRSVGKRKLRKSIIKILTYIF